MPTMVMVVVAKVAQHIGSPRLVVTETKAHLPRLLRLLEVVHAAEHDEVAEPIQTITKGGARLAVSSKAREQAKRVLFK